MEHPFFSNANSNRAEALRWLSIAEKLLNTRDLLGSRSFATRARDADPTLLQADQIIAIADTLIAGEKRINNQHYDWYAILQVPPNQRHDTDFIANQYHRLTLLLNPNKNNLSFADQALRLAVDAWSLLSNRFRKNLYDEEIGFLLTLNQEPGPAPAPNVVSTAQQPGAFNVFPNSSRDQQQMLFASPEQRSISSGQSFLSRDSVQPVTSMQQQQQPSSGRGQQQQPAMFFNLDQQQPLTSVHAMNRDPTQQMETYMPSSGREPHMISFGSSPGRAEQPHVASMQSPRADLPRNTQPPQQNEGSVGKSENIRGSSIDNANNDKEKEVRAEEPKVVIPSFWTACPYCYNMFEYPDAYIDCTLRCHNCKMAYQAIAIASPPPIIDGKDAYFCCWGFIPLGFSVGDWERNRDRATSWSPFSPMFSCPTGGGRNEDTGGKTANYSAMGPKVANTPGGFHNADAPKGGAVHKNVNPRMDDIGGGGGGNDDGLVELSASGGESDDDWQDDTKRKKSKGMRGNGVKTKNPPVRSVQKQHSDKGKNGKRNLIDGLQAQGVTVEAFKKGLVGNTRRHFGRIARDYGKLDLNVEFSNEGEEHPHGMGGHGHGSGRGVDDNIEGIGFFEGLDEFLSSLPILNVVGEDKIKAA